MAKARKTAPAEVEAHGRFLRTETATGQLVGYARTSTVEQEAGLDAQVRDLKAAGCVKVYSEQTSSIGDRPQLDACLGYVREGDVLVVTKPDRLARSTEDLLAIERRLRERGVGLVVISMGGTSFDTRSPTGKLMLTILAGVATWEREIMLERQREGIAKARAEGKYRGRAPTARAKSAEVIALDARGLKRDQIARATGISVPSVYRILADARRAAGKAAAIVAIVLAAALPARADQARQDHPCDTGREVKAPRTQQFVMPPSPAAPRSYRCVTMPYGAGTRTDCVATN